MNFKRRLNKRNFYFSNKVLNLFANKRYGSFAKIQNLSSIYQKLCLLVKNHRGMGCEYRFNASVEYMFCVLLIDMLIINTCLVDTVTFECQWGHVIHYRTLSLTLLQNATKFKHASMYL